MKTQLTTLAALFALAVALPGCAVNQPTAVAAGEAVEHETAVVGRLEVYGPAGYRVQTLTAYNLNDIDHVKLTLQKWNGTAYADVSGVNKTIARAALTSPVTLTNLKMASQYKVVARAYADAAETAQLDDAVDANNSVAFTTPSLVAGSGAQNSSSADAVNDATLTIAIPTRLKNKTFAGQASAANGVAVTNGTIVNTTATESF
jgi:hypothetical protein